MVKGILVLFLVLIVGITSYNIPHDKQENEQNTTTNESLSKKNHRIQKITKTSIKTETIHRENKNLKKIKTDAVPKKSIANTVKKDQLFPNYLEDKTYENIKNDSSLNKEEKERLIMDKIYFEGEKNISASNISEEEIQNLMEEDMNYQLSKQ